MNKWIRSFTHTHTVLTAIFQWNATPCVAMWCTALHCTLPEIRLRWQPDYFGERSCSVAMTGAVGSVLQQYRTCFYSLAGHHRVTQVHVLTVALREKVCNVFAYGQNVCSSCTAVALHISENWALAGRPFFQSQSLIQCENKQKSSTATMLSALSRSGS